MTGHNYPDNLYADHEERKARRTTYQGPLGKHPPTDPVTKPAHYQRAGIETIDYIRATLGDGFEAYCIGNVLKYVSRYREKGGIEDLRKAQVYLGWAIEPVKSDNAAAVSERVGPFICFQSEELRDEFHKQCVDILRDGIATASKMDRVPKWDPRWGVPLTERKGYSQGSHTGTTGPIPQNQPPNCDGHPMQSEALRDHDERLAGGESHL